MHNGISQKDIAIKAEVSQAIVSQVLNNRRSSIRVSKATHEKVTKVAKELGYRPNLIARSLRTKQTTTIGVVVHNNSTLGTTITSAAKLINKCGWELIPAIAQWNAEDEDSQIRRLLDRRVDGLLIISPAVDYKKKTIIEELVNKNYPILCVGTPPGSGVEYIDWDRRKATQELTSHLWTQGCRSFAYLCNSTRSEKELTPGNKQRVEGIEMALKKLGGGSLRILKNISLAEITDKNIEQMTYLIKQALESSCPDAIICQNDILAGFAINTVMRIGFNVPQDITVAGSSGSEFSAFFTPPLTTINAPENLVELATARLLQRIQQKDKSSIKEGGSTLLPGKLVVRQSSMFRKDIFVARKSDVQKKLA